MMIIEVITISLVVIKEGCNNDIDDNNDKKKVLKEQEPQPKCISLPQSTT